MVQLHSLMQDILERGYDHYDSSRQENTKAIFSYNAAFDVGLGFPAVTTKKLAFKSVVAELLWFLRGDTDIKFLLDNGCTIWNDDAYNHFKKRTGSTLSQENFIEAVKAGRIKGLCGPIYGAQWRTWYGADGVGVDQISDVFKSLKQNPFSRRHIVSAWQPSELEDMALPPCHMMFQFNVRNVKGIDYLDLQWYQRSADVFLGVPFNIASYATLLHLFATALGYESGMLYMTLGNAHIYESHLGAVQQMLERNPTTHKLPFLEGEWKRKARRVKDTRGFIKMIEDLKVSDFTLEEYNHYPPIKAAMVAPIV